MSAKHLWSTGCVIQSRFCRSQGSMCWVQCVLQDAGIVASGRRSIGSMNERQNISEFVSLVLHLAVGAHSILELRCRFHIGEREAFASSISSKLWSCGLRHAQVTHHNLLHIWGTTWCPSLCHVFRYFDHLLLCNDKVTIHCICGDQPFWMSWIFFLRMLSPVSILGLPRLIPQNLLNYFSMQCQSCCVGFLTFQICELWCFVWLAEHPIHELWHIVLPCYSCLSCLAVAHLWSVKVMSAKPFLIDRFCYSLKILSIPMFNVLGAVRAAGCRSRSASGRRSIDSMNERQNISKFASLVRIWQSEHIPF